MTETTQDGMTTHQLRLCLAVMCKLPMSDPRHSNTLLQALLAVERLIHIERQILYRDESMPKSAKEWGKDYLGCYFIMACGRGTSITTAPDYRPNEDECTLAIIEPMEK